MTRRGGLGRQQLHQLVEEPRPQELLSLRVRRRIDQDRPGFGRAEDPEEAEHLAGEDPPAGLVGEHARSKRQERLDGVARRERQLGQVGQDDERRPGTLGLADRGHPDRARPRRRDRGVQVLHDRLDVAEERRPVPRCLAPAEPIQDVGLVLQRVPELIQARAVRTAQVQRLGDADELVDLLGEPPRLVERGQQRDELRHDLPCQPAAPGLHGPALPVGDGVLEPA